VRFLAHISRFMDEQKILHSEFVFLEMELFFSFQAFMRLGISSVRMCEFDWKPTERTRLRDPALSLIDGVWGGVACSACSHLTDSWVNHTASNNSGQQHFCRKKKNAWRRWHPALDEINAGLPCRQKSHEPCRSCHCALLKVNLKPDLRNSKG